MRSRSAAILSRSACSSLPRRSVASSRLRSLSRRLRASSGLQAALRCSEQRKRDGAGRGNAPAGQDPRRVRYVLAQSALDEMQARTIRASESPSIRMYAVILYKRSRQLWHG